MKRLITILWIVALASMVSAFNWDFEGSSAYTCPISEWNIDSGGCGTNDTADGCAQNSYVLDNIMFGDAIDGNYVQVGDRHYSCDYSRPAIKSDSFTLPTGSAYFLYDYKGCWGVGSSYQSDLKLYFQNGTILSECVKPRESSYYSSNNWHFVNCSIPSGADGETVYFRAYKNIIDCGNQPSGHTIEAFIFDNLSIQFNNGSFFDESATQNITTLNLTVTNYFNGSVRSDWSAYTDPDFLEYRLWASDLADCTPNDTDPNCGRELIIDQTNPNGIWYIEASAHITGSVIGYYVEVINDSGVSVANSPIVNITQPQCYNDDQCDLNEICIAYECTTSYTEYNINGYVLADNGSAVSGAKVLYVANSFDYNRTFTTDITGFYEGNLPTCPDYEVFISKDGFGTTYEYYYEHWFNATNNYTLYPYNVNFTVTDADNQVIDGALIVVTDVNNISHWYSGTTNSSGIYQFLIKEGYNYSYVVSKTGYYNNNFDLGVWDYGFQTDSLGHHFNRLSVLYETNLTPVQEFEVRDHLTLELISGATIRVREWESQTVLATLTTDANGYANISLNQGEYQYEISKSGYQTDQWYKNLLADNMLVASMVRDVEDLNQYTVNIITIENNIPTGTIFRIDCSPLGGEPYTEYVSSNSSGNYSHIVSEQSICTYRKFADIYDQYSDQLFWDQRLITSNLTIELSYNAVGYQPWYIVVGDFSDGGRIVGATVTVSDGDTGYVLTQYQDNTFLARSFYWEDGVNISIVANKSGYIAEPETNPQWFIVNNSDGGLTRTRALGLIRSGDSCNGNIYFLSDRALGSASDTGTVLIQYSITNVNGSSYYSGEIQDVSDLLLNTPNSIWADVNLECGSSYLVDSIGYSKINGVIRQIYKGDTTPIDSTELFVDVTQIMRYGVSDEDGGSLIDTELGDSVTQPLSEHSNIFSQIIGELLDAFGYEDLSFIEIVFWMAIVTIFVTLSGGSYMIIKWSTSKSMRR